MKKTIDKGATTPTTRLRRFRHTCGAFVEDDRVQSIVLGAIVTNAILLGMGTFDFADPTILFLLDTMDTSCLVLFTIEITLHMIHKGIWAVLSCGGDDGRGWLCFDTIVIVLSWSIEPFQIARAFRIVRAVRLVSQLKSLRTILAALVRVLPSLYSLLGLFAILIYMYAVFCTEVFGEVYAEGLTDDNYFGSLGQSMFTLFQFMTAEDWNSIARPVIQHYYWARFVFGSFVVLTNFILYSLLAAVFCHAATTPDAEQLATFQALQRIQQKVVAAHERQIMVLCQCQVLLPSEDLAVFSPQRRSEKLKLSKQKSFSLQQQPPLTRGLSLTGDVYQNQNNGSTLSILSEDMIEYGDTKFKRVMTFRERCKEGVDDVRFQVLSATLVVLNAISLGVETFDFGDKSELSQAMFIKINRGFLVVFSMELGLNIFAAGALRDVVRDRWLLLDCLIVGVCWAVETVSVARALRVIRVSQLGRRFKPLQELITALAVSAPSISGALFLCVLVVYMYSVLCTVLFGDLFATQGVTQFDYFGRLDKTAFTLFQMLTLEGWGNIAREVGTEYPWAWTVFCSYLILTSPILFSMIIGYMTDAVKGSGYVTKRELDRRIRHLHRQVQSLHAQQHMLLETLRMSLDQQRQSGARTKAQRRG